MKRKLFKRRTSERKTWEPRREERENIIRTNDNGYNNHNKAKRYSINNVIFCYTRACHVISTVASGTVPSEMRYDTMTIISRREIIVKMRSKCIQRVYSHLAETSLVSFFFVKEDPPGRNARTYNSATFKYIHSRVSCLSRIYRETSFVLQR